MDLRIGGVTFNVAEEPPSRDIGTRLIDETGNKPDVFIVALQEVNLGLQIGALLFWDQWTEKISARLADLSYYRIESLRMQGIVLSVFALKTHLPSIRDVRCDWIGTGHANFWGNKGAVAVRFRLYGKTLAVVNTHLPHGVEKSQFEKRITSIDAIFKNVTFREDLHLLQHDLVFFLGDLNFRIKDISRNDVLQRVSDSTILECLTSDELSLLLRNHPVLIKFREQKIGFNPTYKYDKNTSKYDSSSKLRKPAWTDRILTFSKPEDLRPQKYFAAEQIRLSDHRPVFGIYDLKVPSESSKVLEMKVEFDESSCDDVIVKIDIEAQFFDRVQDWVGLYRRKFVDYRDWVTFQWCTFGKESSSQTSQTSSNRVQLQVCLPDIGVTGDYVIGYYSAQHRNLIGLSNLINLPNRALNDFWD